MKKDNFFNAYEILEMSKEPQDRSDEEQDKYIKERANNLLKKISKDINYYKEKLKIHETEPDMTKKINEEIDLLRKKYMDVNDAYELLKNPSSRLIYNNMLKYDKRNLVKPKLIKGQPFVIQDIGAHKAKTTEISEGIKLKKTGMLNYDTTLGVKDDALYCYEITMDEGTEKERKYQVFSEIDMLKYSSDTNYANFVKNRLLSRAHIENSKKFTYSYLGIPSENANGKYELVYPEEHISALAKFQDSKSVIVNNKPPKFFDKLGKFLGKNKESEEQTH